MTKDGLHNYMPVCDQKASWKLLTKKFWKCLGYGSIFMSSMASVSTLEGYSNKLIGT
jgi:hypothetical protein